MKERVKSPVSNDIIVKHVVNIILKTKDQKRIDGGNFNYAHKQLDRKPIKDGIQTQVQSKCRGCYKKKHPW
jgi:predicted transcriptional regulator